MNPVRASAVLALCGCTLAAAPLPGVAQFQISGERTVNLRTGEKGMLVSLEPFGPGGARILAGRVTVSHAEDDTGAALEQQTTYGFHTVSVGRVDNSKDMTSREPIAFSLWGLSKDARFIRSVSGVMEFIVPDLDPLSTAVIEALPSKLGSPVDSPELAAAGITVAAYDRASAAAAAGAKAPGGPQDYDSGPLFGPSHPPPGFFRKIEMEDGDVAVAVDDRDDRLVSVDFEAPDGSPLRYNHAGNYHSSGLPGHPGRRFDIYRMGYALPAGARMVCRITTEKALLKVPFHVDMLPIPEAGPGGRRALGMMGVSLQGAEDLTRANRQYERESGDSTAHRPSGGEFEEMLGLWIDAPLYAAFLQRDDSYSKLPQLVSSVFPDYPSGVLLAPGAKVTVDVSFVVDEKGRVEAARVINSADGRFDASALEAVLRWRFRPGEIGGSPARTFVRVPFVFVAPIGKPVDLFAPPSG